MKNLMYLYTSNNIHRYWERTITIDIEQYRHRYWERTITIYIKQYRNMYWERTITIDIEQYRHRYWERRHRTIQTQVLGEDLYTSNNIDTGTGSGQLLYTSKDLKAKQVYFESKFKESVFVTLDLKDGDCLIIGLIYRSGSGEMK